MRTKKKKSNKSKRTKLTKKAKSHLTGYFVWFFLSVLIGLLFYWKKDLSKNKLNRSVASFLSKGKDFYVMGSKNDWKPTPVQLQVDNPDFIIKDGEVIPLNSNPEEKLNPNLKYLVDNIYKGDITEQIDAYFQLATLYEQRSDSDKWKAQELGIKEKDIHQAVSYYKEAALKGHVISQYRLGDIYRKWNLCKEAKKWLMKAAGKEHAYALTSMGIMYARGKCFKKSMPAAIKFLEKGALRGSSTAQYNLATLLSRQEKDQHGNSLSARSRYHNKYLAYVWFHVLVHFNPRLAEKKEVHRKIGGINLSHDKRVDAQTDINQKIEYVKKKLKKKP